MTAVDVLAVMAQAKEEIRRYRENLGVTAPSITIPDLAEARDAVVELMDAAAEMNRLAKGPVGGVSQSDKKAIVSRVGAALTRCRGEGA